MWESGKVSGRKNRGAILACGVAAQRRLTLRDRKQACDFSFENEFKDQS